MIEVGGMAVEADASREVLKRVGIDRARGFIAAVGTDAENVYAVLSARLLRPDLFISSEYLELWMEQVQIAPSSALAGPSLLDVNLRRRYRVVVAGIQRAGGAMEFNPPPDAVMKTVDQLVVLGRSPSL